MWYKKSYKNDATGSFESLDIFDAFKEFYAKEVNEHPNDAKGLAMFGPGANYFHSNSHYHIKFFDDSGCTSCKKPSHKLEFWHGDKEFAGSLSKK